MAEAFQSPLRASSSSFSCFPALFFVHSQALFAKPSRCCNFKDSIHSFGPLRSPKRRDRFRNVLSKLNRNSDSEDFGLISASEHSDGSFIFRFGNAKDKEAVVAKKVSQRSDDSEKVKTRSKSKRKSKKTQLSREAKTLIDQGVSSSVNEGLSCSSSSVDEISVDGKVLSNVIVSDFDEDIERVYEDESSELNSSSDISHDSRSVASNNLDETNDTCLTTISKSDVQSLDKEMKNNVSTVTSARTSLDEDANPSASSDEIVIVKPIEPLAEKSLDGDTNPIASSDEIVMVKAIKPLVEISLDEDMNPSGSSDEIEIVRPIEPLVRTSLDEDSSPSASSNEIMIVKPIEPVAETSLGEDANPSASSDETVIVKPIKPLVEICLDEDVTRTLDWPEASIQLGHTNEVKDEEIKDEMDIAEVLPISEALEVEEIKDEIYVVEKLPISEALEVEETPNREEISTKEFILSSGASLLRHPTEGSTGGEDAYFVTCKNWLGVADGVGQWSLEGISDGQYAQELMENCKRIVSDSEATPSRDPSEVLVRSVKETESSGSSTILVAHFDGQAFKVANIGDSGFIIIRKGSVFQQSSPIVHNFNFPLHVERGDDRSEFIESYNIKLDEDDVIVTATDGLFDNLYDQEIASFVLESLKAGLEPQGIAESLCSKAQESARSSSKKTPFSDAAQKAGYSGYSGGKLDNVVVIVSIVRKK